MTLSISEQLQWDAMVAQVARLENRVAAIEAAVMPETPARDFGPHTDLAIADMGRNGLFRYLKDRGSAIPMHASNDTLRELAIEAAAKQSAA